MKTYRAILLEAYRTVATFAKDQQAVFSVVDLNGFQFVALLRADALGPSGRLPAADLYRWRSLTGLEENAVQISATREDMDDAVLALAAEARAALARFAAAPPPLPPARASIR